MKHYELTRNAHPWATQRGESKRNEIEPGSRAEYFQSFSSPFSISQSIIKWQYTKLIFLRLRCFCSLWQLVNDLSVFIWPISYFFGLIFSPILLRRSEGSVNVWQLAMVNTAQRFTFQTRYSSLQKQCFGTKDQPDFVALESLLKGLKHFLSQKWWIGHPVHPVGDIAKGSVAESTGHQILPEMKHQILPEMNFRLYRQPLRVYQKIRNC